MRPATRFPAAAAALALGTAAAGTLQTYQCLLPSARLEIFGDQFSFVCTGPPAGEILRARADLEYANDPGDDAADLMVSVQAPSEGLPVWVLRGADLGWSGVGMFTAQVETHVLDGVIDLGIPPPEFSEFMITIEMADGGPLEGQFTHSTFEIDIVGKPCPWDLDFDDEVGIEDFLALVAQWGTDPGGPPDFDSDGAVDIDDFLEILANWGPCP